MRTKQFDGIQYTNENDYLAGPFGSTVNHVLVDSQDKRIIAQEKMTVFEKEKRNAAARKVGERYLVWVAALYK